MSITCALCLACHKVPVRLLTDRERDVMDWLIAQDETVTVKDYCHAVEHSIGQDKPIICGSCLAAAIEYLCRHGVPGPVMPWVAEQIGLQEFSKGLRFIAIALKSGEKP